MFRTPKNLSPHVSFSLRNASARSRRSCSSQRTQGYSGGYTLSGSTWRQKVSKGNIYGRLDNLLGLSQQGDKHIKYNSDGIEYCVYDLSVDVDNAPLAPSTTRNIEQFEATSTIMLEVPLSFCGDILPPMKIELTVKSKYTPKF